MAKNNDMIAKLAQRLAELNKTSERREGTGASFIDIKDGRNVVRILPPRPDAEMFYEEVWVHYGVGKTKENPKGTMIVCPTTHGENNPCPVCELSKQFKALSKKKDDQYDKQAKEHYRKKRVYYNAIDRSEDLSKYEKNEDGKWINTETGEEETPVKVLGTGIGVFKDLLALIVDPEYGDITDPEEGLDVIITKTGSGQFNTNYDVKTVRKESPIGYEHWEECLHDLKQFSKVKSYDEIMALLSGEAPANNADSGGPADESDEPPAEEPANAGESTGDDLQDEIKAALARRRAQR